MKFEIIILFVTILVGCASCADEFPSSIDRCKVEDEECLLKAWSKMTKLAETEGIPGLGLPISEKQFVERQELSVGSNVMTIKILFQNVTVLGLTRVDYQRIQGFKKDPKEMKSFSLTGFCSYISVKGHYDASGKLLLLQVTGEGEGEVQFYNNTFKVTVSTKTKVKDGEEYLVPTKVRCDYQSERNHFRFENILNNKEISDGINQVINDNQELFSKEVRRPTEISFANVFTKVLTGIFDKYPYRSFFLE